MTDSDVVAVLVGRPFDAAALDRAAAEYPDADLTALAVVTPLDAPFSEGQVLSPTDERFLEARRRAERLVEDALSGADDPRTPADVRIVVAQGRPAPVVAERAERLDADQIVIGARDRSALADYLLGDGVAAAIADQTDVPVDAVEVDQAVPSAADSTR